MPNCVDYDCTELSDHIQNSCNELILGGADAVGLLTCDHQLTDPSDLAEITSEVNAGRLFIAKGVRVGIPAGSPITVGPYTAGETSTTVNYERTVTLTDPNYNQDNITFYDLAVNNKKFGGALVRLKDSDKLIWLDFTLTMDGSPIVPDDTNDAIRFECTLKGRSKNMGNLYTNSSSLFD